MTVISRETGWRQEPGKSEEWKRIRRSLRADDHAFDLGQGRWFATALDANMKLLVM